MSPIPPPALPGSLADLDLRVDRSAELPVYLQLKQQLECAVRDGRQPAGAPLPSERALAAALGLSRMTVRRAYEALVEAGLVEQRHGAGTFVRGQALEQPLERLTSYSEATRLSGYEPGSELVTVEQVPASGRVAQALEVEPGAPLLRLLRLRTADGEPLELQDAYLPPRFLELSIVELTQSGSLYRTLDTQFGVRPLRGRQWVGARQPTSLELRHLRLSRDVPVLSKERITYGLDERPIEYVLAVARSDKYRLVVHMAEEQAGY